MNTRSPLALACMLLLPVFMAACSGSGDSAQACEGLPHEIVSIGGVVDKPPHPDLASGQSTGGAYRYLFPLRTPDDKVVKCKTMEQFKGAVPKAGVVEATGYWEGDVFMVCGVQRSD